VSEQTLYAWRKRFGGMDANDAKRLKTLEAENNKLKKLLAESALALEVMKEINAKNGERTRKTTAGGVCAAPRPVVSVGVCAAASGSLRAALRVETQKTRCSRAAAHA
jgi:putative transposase